jgi:hypothetical protein
MIPDYMGLGLYPGGEIVARGLSDLSEERLTEDALAVLIAGPRLAQLGFTIAEVPGSPINAQHALYESLEARLANDAHAVYNSIVELLDSFAHAYTQAQRSAQL